MSMENVLQVVKSLKVINQMKDDGVIDNYAIGGAIGATFYLEPTSTYDLDIFIPFKETPGKRIVSPEPIYGYLENLGYKPKGAHIVIEGWDVQFLPADDKLYSEALVQANETLVGGIATRVITAEHLMAIALKTGRGKDFIRIEQFIESKNYDANKLKDIIARHDLLAKWKQFNEKYGGVIE